jgi:hypothetical protein
MLFDIIMYSLSGVALLGIAAGAVFLARLVREGRQRERAIALRKAWVDVPPKPSRHPHDTIVPVDADGVRVAFLCTTCDAQLELTDPSVIKWEERRRADEEWRAIWSSPSAADQAREDVYQIKAELARRAERMELLSRETTNVIVNEWSKS